MLLTSPSWFAAHLPILPVCPFLSIVFAAHTSFLSCADLLSFHAVLHAFLSACAVQHFFLYVPCCPSFFLCCAAHTFFVRCAANLSSCAVLLTLTDCVVLGTLTAHTSFRCCAVYLSFCAVLHTFLFCAVLHTSLWFCSCLCRDAHLYVALHALPVCAALHTTLSMLYCMNFFSVLCCTHFISVRRCSPFSTHFFSVLCCTHFLWVLFVVLLTTMLCCTHFQSVLQCTPLFLWKEMHAVNCIHFFSFLSCTAHNFFLCDDVYLSFNDALYTLFFFAMLCCTHFLCVPCCSPLCRAAHIYCAARFLSMLCFTLSFYPVLHTFFLCCTALTSIYCTVHNAHTLPFCVEHRHFADAVDKEYLCIFFTFVYSVFSIEFFRIPIQEIDKIPRNSMTLM
jgi:hypothetical protein